MHIFCLDYSMQFTQHQASLAERVQQSIGSWHMCFDELTHFVGLGQLASRPFPLNLRVNPVARARMN